MTSRNKPQLRAKLFLPLLLLTIVAWGFRGPARNALAALLAGTVVPWLAVAESSSQGGDNGFDLTEAIIPHEVIEKDYGCGDPSRYLKSGETVLDLGSGTGKVCFMAAQVVGPTGRVIGVDMTDDMLEVARRNAPIAAERLGLENVEFRKGRIQDLGLDLEFLFHSCRFVWFK